MEDVNLDQAIYYADSARGVYIPQYFAETIHRDMTKGVSSEDWKILEAGPDHEFYWDVWCSVLDNCILTHPDEGCFYLWQDGDLWLVPIDAA